MCTLHRFVWGDLSAPEFYLTTVLRPIKTYTPLIYSAQAKVFIWHVADGQKDKSLFRSRLPFDPGVGWVADDGHRPGSRMAKEVANTHCLVLYLEKKGDH